MMKTLLAIPIFLVLFTGLMAGIGVALPDTYQVSRSMDIHAEPAEVYAKINDLEMWPDWVYWNTDNVDELKVSLGEVTQGVGASQSWSEKHGDGKLTFTECVENKKITMKMEFGEFPPMYSTITLTTKEVDVTDEETEEVKKVEVTEVTWTANGEMGNDPMSGWFGLILKPMIGRDYDYGLAKLKAQLEKS